MTGFAEVDDLQAIRQLSSIPLPDDDGYVFRLGAAMSALVNERRRLAK
jgi:hypothetical protein